MRTTISIDDEVMRSAKQRAAAEGKTLGQLVTEALRERVVRRPRRGRERYAPVTFGEGGTRPGVDLTNNAAVRDLMDEG
jgi:Arc/MetJ family transcription regulator